MRTVLYVEPFDAVRIPIATLSEQGGAVHVEPLPLPDMAPAARWVAEQAVNDIREAPSMNALPASVGPHVVFADTGRQV